MLTGIFDWNYEVTEIINSGDYEAAKTEILKEAEVLTDNDNIYDWVVLVTDDLDYVEGEEHAPFEITKVTMGNFLDDVVNVLIEEEFTGKQWKDVNEEDKDLFLHLARPTEDEGECIVDFDYLSISIPGKVVSNEYETVIEIEDDAEFYNPCS